MFDTLFGVEVSPAVKFFLAFVIVFILIGVIAWVVRRYGSERFGGSAARGRQPRLAVVDAAAVDGRRRLLIIRRDNVEHLLMIGGPTDVVVETNIVRAAGASRDRDAATGRPATLPDAFSRPVPPGEGSMWPLQPQQEANQRPQRTTVVEETMQWTSWQSQPEPPRSPRPEPMAGLAEELSAHAAPQRDTGLSTGRKPAAAAAGTDQNLAEMAQRLESALRQPQDMRPAAEMPAKAEPAPRRPAAPEQKPAAESKPGQPKSLYDNLEQEMANLLGRPPGKP
ncbi:MAG: flagellar biosynthetic protein FliO [Xanthobacteraceae bacterium]